MTETQVAPQAEEAHPHASAPYMSYKGFKNYLTKFREDGLPARFDGSYFGNASGSLVAQVRGTFYFLGLMDEAKAPTDLLKLIVESDEDEQGEYLKLIFEEKYADALALDINATSGQLAEVFRDRGLSGATVTKAITFFLGMAEDVGATLSPHFKKGRTAASGNGGGRKRRAAKAVEPPVAPTPPPRAATEEEQKAQYISMLMDLAKDNDESSVQQSLLDRIEKALGIGGTPQ